jgi:hypothetical protein
MRLASIVKDESRNARHELSAPRADISAEKPVPHIFFKSGIGIPESEKTTVVLLVVVQYDTVFLYITA